MRPDAWAKSSYSFANGNCLEWRKSSASTVNGQCVEIGGHVRVRDSQDPGGPVLSFTPAAWRAFIGDVKGG